MSIINDALKKTQLNIKRPKRKQKKEADQPQADGQKVSNVYEKLYKNRQKKTGTSSPKVAQGQKPATPKKKQKTKSRLPALLKLIIFLACAAAAVLFLKDYQPLQDAFPDKFQKRSSTQYYRPKPVKKRKYKPGELILNGTSTIDGKKVALINDEIYELGDSVNGKEIISIGLNRVELTDNKKIFTIKVR